jgi:hypothetical protein
MWSTKTDQGLRFFSVSLQDFEDWKAQATSFSSLAAFDRQQDLTLTAKPTPNRSKSPRFRRTPSPCSSAARARAILFPGGGPDRRAGRPVVISHATWRDRFGADSGAVGRVMTLNGEPWTVIGVMPRTSSCPETPPRSGCRCGRTAGSGVAATGFCGLSGGSSRRLPRSGARRAPHHRPEAGGAVSGHQRGLERYGPEHERCGRR